MACAGFIVTAASPGGDDLVRMLAALASPHRMRVVAALAGGRWP
jgi:hypothetical protein